MNEKIKEVQEALKAYGYLCDDTLAKRVYAFMKAPEHQSELPAMLVTGPSGAGKTSLAEVFAKFMNANETIVQCYQGMTDDKFHMDINIRAVMENDSENAIMPGMLLKAINDSHNSPVVLVVDEFDKTSPGTDAFLLDFIENGRLTTGTQEYKKGQYPIFVIITSNNERDFSDALRNRCRYVDLKRPEKEMFLKILGLPEDHYLGYIYDICPDFSIRQAKAYLADLASFGIDFDATLLEQYIENFSELNIDSLEKLEMIRNSQIKPLVESPQISYPKVVFDPTDIAWNEMLDANPEYRALVSTVHSYNHDFPDFIIKIESLEMLTTIASFENEEGESLLEHTNVIGFVDSGIPKDADLQGVVWYGGEDSGKDMVRYGVFRYYDSAAEEDKVARLKRINGKTYVEVNYDTSPHVLLHEFESRVEVSKNNSDAINLANIRNDPNLGQNYSGPTNLGD